MTTPHRFVAGAIDLGELKAQAEAKAAASQTQSQHGISPVVTLTMANVEEELIKRSAQVPVIVLIGSPRSPESEQLKTDFTKIAQGANLSFIFAYLNADETPDVARMFGIQGLPTVVALAAGQPIANFEGGQPAAALQQWTQAVVDAVKGQLTGLPSVEETETVTEDPRFVAAAEAVENGDFDGAISMYDAILAAEPKNVEAQAARDNARLLARLGKADATIDPIDRANTAPTDVAAGLAAADAEIAAGDAEAAFTRLITLIGAAPASKKEITDRLLELFALFDAADPRVLAARGKLASALF